jgi:hypothetical protein
VEQPERKKTAAGNAMLKHKTQPFFTIFLNMFPPIYFRQVAFLKTLSSP